MKTLPAAQKIKSILASENPTHALKAAGWSPSDLKAAGWSPSDLIAAGWSPSELIAAGWSPSALKAAGWSPSALKAAEKEWDSIPMIPKLYSRLLSEIEAGKRIHNQSTFGPDCDPATNLCKTQMCTAGHLVNMCGEVGYELKSKYGWEGAARMIHNKNRPGVPAQNFGGIPQDFAIAYIRERAEEEKD